MSTKRYPEEFKLAKLAAVRQIAEGGYLFPKWQDGLMSQRTVFMTGSRNMNQMRQSINLKCRAG